MSIAFMFNTLKLQRVTPIFKDTILSILFEFFSCYCRTFKSLVSNGRFKTFEVSLKDKLGAIAPIVYNYNIVNKIALR